MWALVNLFGAPGQSQNESLRLALYEKKEDFSMNSRTRLNPNCGSGPGLMHILRYPSRIKIVAIYKNFFSNHDFFSVKLLQVSDN